MKALLRGFLVLTAPVVVACAGHSEAVDAATDASVDARAPVSPRTICDGSGDLRVFVAVVGGGLSPAQFRVLQENGSFIAIDGRCRYWVRSGENVFEETRSGVLDSDMLAEFVDDFRYDYWPELPGRVPSGVPIWDASDIVFMDRTTRIICVSNCLGASTPADVVAMREANNAWNARLWAAGEAVTGDVRASVIESGGSPEFAPARWNLVATPWPLSIPIESVAVSEATGESEALGYGDGILFTGPDAEALRTLRNEFVRNDPASTGLAAIMIRDGDGPFYYVDVRDTTPFEDELGLIPMLHRWPGY